MCLRSSIASLNIARREHSQLSFTLAKQRLPPHQFDKDSESKSPILRELQSIIHLEVTRILLRKEAKTIDSKNRSIILPRFLFNHNEEMLAFLDSMVT